jgi:type I restriction enzyme, S subunit
MKQSSYKYKESRVVWLGDIPDHWELKKVKHIARFYTGWTPPSGNEEYYDGEYPWANISDLGTKYLRIPVRTITQEAVDSLRMKLSNTGSLLFSFKLSIGLVSLLKNDMYTNEAIATFPPNNKIKTSFLYYIAPVAIPMNC